MIDWLKPLRFKTVQGNDHAKYKPQIMSYKNDVGQLRRIAMIRTWDSAPSGAVYDEDGKIVAYLVSSTGSNAFNASGVNDATLVNGAEIVVKRESTGGGAQVKVTYEGGKAIKVELA